MTCWSKIPREVTEDLVRKHQPRASQQRKGSEVWQQGRQGQWPHWQGVQSHIRGECCQVHPTVQITGQVQSGESGLSSSLEVKTASQRLDYWYMPGTVELPCGLSRDQGQESHLKSISWEKRGDPPLRLLTVLIQGWTAALQISLDPKQPNTQELGEDTLSPLTDLCLLMDSHLGWVHILCHLYLIPKAQIFTACAILKNWLDDVKILKLGSTIVCMSKL